jgi:hypothetical protein
VNFLTSEGKILTFLYSIVKMKLAAFQGHGQKNMSLPNGPLAGQINFSFVRLTFSLKTPPTSPVKKTGKILLVKLVNICSKPSQGIGADEKHLAANKARSELLSGNSQPLLSEPPKNSGDENRLRLIALKPNMQPTTQEK